VETDCEHEWEPLEFEDGEKSKASVCSKCGALKSGQGSMVITADYIDFSPLTADPTLAEGRQWFRSDYDALYWSPDGSVKERIKSSPPAIAQGSLTTIKGFEYLVEGSPTDSWLFTMNPSAGVWIKQYSTDASFNAQMVYHGAYKHWTADNTFVDVPNKADNVYGAGEEAVVHMVPDGTQIGGFASIGNIPMGMTWDGSYLWCSEAGAGYIYKLTKDGTQKGAIYRLGQTPRGLTWDGAYLWNLSDAAAYVYQMTTGGVRVSGFAPPTTTLYGLTWDGTYLWYSDAGVHYVYQMKPDGTQVGSFASPAGTPKGMGWDGKYLWCTSDDANTIYKLTTGGTQKGNFASPQGNPADLAWDGTYFWHADATADYIYQLGNAGNFDLDYKIAT